MTSTGPIFAPDSETGQLLTTHFPLADFSLQTITIGVDMGAGSDGAQETATGV